MQRAGPIGKSTASARRADAPGIRRPPPARTPIIGNQAALRALSRGAPPVIQRKLRVGAVDDPLEHEADRAAEQVMRMPQPQGIRIAGREDEFAEPMMQGTVLRKAAPAAASGGPPVHAPASLDRGGAGEPLPAPTRRHMERAFGCDFARVRVHRDAAASETSRRLGALAFTYGGDIYFGDGLYDPAGSTGTRLLAHELAHVVQQGQGAASMIRRSTTWDPAGHVDPANNLADVVLNGAPAGETWPTINGKIVKDADQVVKALHLPTLAFAAVPAAQKGAPDAYDATVGTVPNNAGSFDSRTLAPGPWREVAPKATIKRIFGLDVCSGNGNSTFTAIGTLSDGTPNDRQVFDANQRHEGHHGTDDKAAFDANIGAWDKKLEAARKAGTRHHGATKADAEAALYRAMGGTPQDVAGNFVDAVSAAGADFHRSQEGGAVNVSNWKASRDCSVSSAECTNPS